MGKTTGIAWTDGTFNPWWGCARVSDGCLHCYAESSSKRYGFDLWGKRAERRLFGDKHWRQPRIWNDVAERAGRPKLVFCASMADVFEDHPAVVEARARLWELVVDTPWLRWQLLTKRPENVLRLVPEWWLSRLVERNQDGRVVIDVPRWPANVWLGTTVEHQSAAVERVPILLNVPAPVRFLSCEPLLGPLNLPNAIPASWHGAYDFTLPGIDWVIVGGESGNGHRPMDRRWATSIVNQCERVNVPVFFKQVGGTKYHDGVAGGDLLDGRRIKQFPPQAGRDVAVAVH